MQILLIIRYLLIIEMIFLFVSISTIEGKQDAIIIYSKDLPSNIRPYVDRIEFDSQNGAKNGVRLYFNDVPPISGKISKEIAGFIVNKKPEWKGSRNVYDIANEINFHWALARMHWDRSSETRKNAISPTHLEYHANTLNGQWWIFSLSGPSIGIISDINRKMDNRILSESTPSPRPTATPTITPAAATAIPAPTTTPHPTDAPITEASKAENDDLGGVNFTSFNFNYISVVKDEVGGANIDFVLKAKKAEGALPGIDLINATLLSTISLMTGISLPSDKFWVNLNPWEPDRIIDDELAKTDVGRIMLEADLQMKKDFSNYGNPCANKTGKALWTHLEEKQKNLVDSCMEKFPGEIKEAGNVRFGAVTRYWIIPDKIDVYTNGTDIYIQNSTLNIRSEPTSEYSFFEMDNQNLVTLSRECHEELNKSAREFNQYARDLQDRMILPFVLSDVNHDKKYEDLRNVYYSLALAELYKGKIATEVDIFQASPDPSDLNALDAMISWSPKEVWGRYVYSFKNGEYKCWQNETAIVSNEIRIQSKPYSAGGVDFGRIRDNMTLIKGIPPDIMTKVDEAISKGVVDGDKEALFGTRVHVDLRSNNSGPGPFSSLNQTSSGKRDEDASCSPCPEGWNGPYENCECWMQDCPPGWYRPDEQSECEIWTNPMECPPGYEGPNEEGKCLEMQCPAGYEGPNENGYCWKYEAVSPN